MTSLRDLRAAICRTVCLGIVLVGMVAGLVVRLARRALHGGN